MLAVYIIVGLIALVLIILSIPLYIQINFDEKFSYKIKFLLFSINSEKPKKPKKKKQKKEKPLSEETKKKENTIKKVFKEKGLLGTVSYISEIVSSVSKSILSVLKAIKFSKLELEIVAADKDAAKAAVQYGEINAAVFPILSFLYHNLEFGKVVTDIRPDFDKGNPTAYIKLKLRLIKHRLPKAIFTIIKLILNFMKKDGNKK